MNFEQQVRLIAAASGDPKKIALVLLEIGLAAHPPALLRVVEAASVLRCFDKQSLSTILDQDLRPEIDQWFDRLCRLDCIEAFEERASWNVHETTRLAVRERLQATDPARIAELSLRATHFFGSDELQHAAERAYFAVLAEPTGCYAELRQTVDAIQANPTIGQSLAQALWEYSQYPGWPPLTRAWSLLIRASVLDNYRPIDKSIRDCEEALSLFTATSDSTGESWCQTLLGSLLWERSQPGDAEQALAHFTRSLQVRERLLAANPESAQAARDVLVSLERMAGFEGGRLGGEAKALELQSRSLEIALKLREQNLTSYFYHRTAAISFMQTHKRARAAKSEELANQCLIGCFSVLDALVQTGVELDPSMRQLHAQLKPMFTPPPQQPTSMD